MGKLDIFREAEVRTDSQNQNREIFYPALFYARGRKNKLESQMGFQILRELVGDGFLKEIHVTTDDRFIRIYVFEILKDFKHVSTVLRQNGLLIEPLKLWHGVFNVDTPWLKQEECP